jgi:hypothetical protein
MRTLLAVLAAASACLIWSSRPTSRSLKVDGDTLDLSSEQRILTFQHQRGQCCHSSGSL